MGKAFYLKLACSNLGKNRRFYFPYVLSCMLMVMLHFVLCNLTYTDSWDAIPSNSILYSILNLGIFVVELFALILLFYTNIFLMKRRKREFGLYNVLGMEKRHIGRVLFWETCMAFGASIAVGLGLGLLLSKLAELLLCNMLQFEIRYAVEFLPKSFLRTLTVFPAYALLILLHSLWQLRKAKPVELLHSVSAGEREPKANWLLALIGVFLLGLGYWIAVTIQNPVDALLWFFVAVILVILGTYCCFIAGSVASLKLLRRIKAYYYQTNHFISVGGMLHRMKQNGAGLATICILSTMVLVMVSGTASLYVGNTDILQNRYPREMVLICRENAVDGLRVAEEVSQNALQAQGLSTSRLLTYRYAYFTAYLEGATVELDADKMELALGSLGDGSVLDVCLVPLEDYNRSTGQNITLNPGEVLLHKDAGTYGHDSITLLGNTFRIVEELPDFLDNGFSSTDVVPFLYLVVPSVDIMDSLLQAVGTANGEEPISANGYYCFDTGAAREEQLTLYRTIREETRYRTDVDISVESRVYEEQDFYSIFGGLFFIGIFLGLLFLLATSLIIYYKQITEGYEDQSRFHTLQQVGMSKGEVRRVIHSQVLTVFFLPLITAGIHTAFAFPMISKMLRLFALTNQTLLMLTTGATFLLFACIYSVVYLLTSRFYYRIVSSNRR